MDAFHFYTRKASHERHILCLGPIDDHPKTGVDARNRIDANDHDEMS